MKQLEKGFEKLRQKARKHVITLVKRRFKSNKNLTTFIMGQGCYYFIDIHGSQIWDFDYKELHEFVEKWDKLYFTYEYLKLTRDENKVI